MMSLRQLRFLSIFVASAAIVSPTVAEAAGMPVFDATNYAQNLLQAARALEQIEHQVTSLRNEAGMLATMEQNLKPVDFPQLARLKTAMGEVNRLMGQAQAVRFKVAGLDSDLQRLFPGALGKSVGADQRVAAARAAFDAADASYRQSMAVQARIAENVEADAATLGELAQTSQSSAGALQVTQAANQLIALSVKQQLQIQSLMASEFRAAALDRARRGQAELDGHEATRRFLGSSARN